MNSLGDNMPDRVFTRSVASVAHSPRRCSPVVFPRANGGKVPDGIASAPESGLRPRERPMVMHFQLLQKLPGTLLDFGFQMLEVLL